MYQYRNDSVSVDEYFQIRENSDALLEYIDGFVYMSPSPTTKHQRISNSLEMKFRLFLDGKSCELFHAPSYIIINQIFSGVNPIYLLFKV
nr:Uma2 family endonuclease [Virgibacillus ihumii]